VIKINNIEYHKSYYEKNKERIRAYKKQYYLINAERIKMKSKEYYKKNRNRILQWRRKYEQKCYAENPNYKERAKKRGLKWRLKTHYNLTPEDLIVLLEHQQHICPICKKSLALPDVAIDHNHQTGKIRGLLHRKCNLGIGLLNDIPEYAYNAYIYLKESDKY